MNQTPSAPLILPRGPRYPDSFEVLIERFNEKGVGVGTLHALIGPQQQPRRYRVNVRKAIPGDRVRVSVEKARKSELTCRVEELLEPAASRIEPECAHFGFREQPGKGCGGCGLQMLGYDDQLRAKHGIVARLFEQAGLPVSLLREPIAARAPFYYRNKMEFSFGDNPQRDFALGLHPVGYRHDVLALTQCMLESEFCSAFVPAVSAAIQALGVRIHSQRTDEGFLKNLVIREGKRTGERLVELVTSSNPHASLEQEELPAEQVARAVCAVIMEQAEALGEPFTSAYWTQHHVKKGEPTRFIEHHMHGEPSLTEQLHLPGDHVLSFEVHPRAFFQPNTLQAEVLYAQVLKDAGLLGASPQERPSLVLDLYCGTGTIGLCMAPYVERVVGVELRAEAVENARDNARKNGIENAEFFAGDVGEVMGSPAFAAYMSQGSEVVVVDPPRAGLVPAAREQLKALAPARIVYVSCNPKSLARDLADLIKRGFRVEKVQPVDMFPQTYHIENVALLTRIA